VGPIVAIISGTFQGASFLAFESDPDFTFFEGPQPPMIGLFRPHVTLW